MQLLLPATPSRHCYCLPPLYASASACCSLIPLVLTASSCWISLPLPAPPPLLLTLFSTSLTVTLLWCGVPLWSLGGSDACVCIWGDTTVTDAAAADQVEEQLVEVEQDLANALQVRRGHLLPACYSLLPHACYSLLRPIHVSMA